MIEVKNLRVAFPDKAGKPEQAVKGISFTIGDGEILGIVGGVRFRQDPDGTGLGGIVAQKGLGGGRNFAGRQRPDAVIPGGDPECPG